MRECIKPMLRCGVLLLIAAVSRSHASVCSRLAQHPRLGRLAAPYPARVCSRPLSTGALAGAGQDDGPVRFLVLMQHGRVGSTWLTNDLLNTIPGVTCLHEHLDDNCCHTIAQATDRYKSYFKNLFYSGDSHRPPMNVTSGWLGAAQKFSTYAAFAPRLDLGSQSPRLVCLARSNPVEEYMGIINGDAHQRDCKMHTYKKNSSCTGMGAGALMDIVTQAQFPCHTQGLIANADKFMSYCEKAALKRPVFWLEYRDLLCHLNETMETLLSFLNVDKDKRVPGKELVNQKLTAPLSAAQTLLKPPHNWNIKQIGNKTGTFLLLSLRSANTCDGAPVQNAGDQKGHMMPGICPIAHSAGGPRSSAARLMTDVMLNAESNPNVP
jgi:hypothetical protein